MVESLGDYFAAASIAGAPVPPPGVISRAISIQVCTAALDALEVTAFMSGFMSIVLHSVILRSSRIVGRGKYILDSQQ